MGSSAPEGRPASEILKANVDTTQVEPAPTRTPSGPTVLPLVLAGILLFVLGAGAALFWSTSQQRAQQAAVARPTATALAQALAGPAGVSSASAGSAGAGSAGAGAPPDVNGISCDSLESTIVHIHAHLAVFVNGEEQQIPFGVGIGQPWQVSDSAEGPFVTNGSCFYWIHTHTEDGILHVESPVRRRFTLGDFFAIWQVPLNANQLGPAQGQVITYVNGQRSTSAPQDVPLLPHERIQLDVGGDVAPYPFDFPDGD